MEQQTVSFKVLLLGFTILSSVLFQPVSPVFALTEDTDEMFEMTMDELMDIKVEVASLFPESDLVVGSSATSISSDKWRSLGARRVHEVLNNEMSVFTYPFFNTNAIAIRGYTTGQSTSGIATLIDGVPLNDLGNGSGQFHLSNLELGTLSRIELIKGPGSAIYGSDAFHGVLSVKTFESDEDQFIVEAATAYPLYGNANMKMSQGFADDHIRIDMAVGMSGQDDQDLEYEYDDNGTTGKGKRKHEYDSETGIFKVRYNPDDKLKIKLGAYVISSEGEDFSGIGSNNPGVWDKDLYSNDSLTCMGKSDVSYRFDNNISTEVSMYYWDLDSESDLHGNQNIFPEIYSRVKREESRFGAKFIVKQPDNSLNLQWLLACSYDRQKIESYSVEVRSGGLLIQDLGERPRSGWTRNIHSAFGQLKWGVLEDRMYFILGGRVDDYSDFGTQITPRAGVIFLPTEDSSIKALYGRAFNAPNALHIYGVTGFADGDSNIDPEEIDVYELIYMRRHENWKLSVNGFYSYWKNGIIAKFQPSPTALFTWANEGKSRAYGGEVNLFYSADPFAYDVGFSYVRSKAMDSLNTFTMETEDQEYELFPEYSINLGLHYTLMPMNIKFYLNNRIYLNMEETIATVDPDVDALPTYYRMDLNITKIVSEKLEVCLDIRDLLNRKNDVPAIVDCEKGYEEPGISVLLQATYKF